MDERLDAPELACPQCGAPFEPDQEYCLECGTRLPVSRMPAPRPRRWIWVAIALAIVVAGAIVGLVAAAGSGEEAAPLTTSGERPAATTAAGPDLGDTGALPGFETVTLPPPTQTLPPSPETLPGLTVTPPATTTAPVTTAPEPATTQPPSGLIQWPAGTDGYTVVLASVLASQGRAAADAQAVRARAAGLPQVGVLDSSSYSSLRPGYWVVFSGIYSSEAQARAAMPAARAKGFPDAYPRRVAD